MIDDDLARLSRLPQRLRDEGYETPPYRTIRDAALDGVFDARQINGLWYFKPARTAEIAQQLRLKKCPAPIDRSESQSVAAE